MNNLQTFNNPEFGEIRTMQINNEPWFVGKDVTDILGYQNGTRDINRHVDDEDKGSTEMVTPGGKQSMTIINESGLYSLIMGSKLPSAKKFKRWVTSEVLPSIRKNGAYMTEQTLEKALASPDFLIQLATQLKEEQDARKQAEKIIEEQKPKTIFADAVASSKTSILIGDLAKLICQNGYKIGQRRLFEWLRANNFLIKNGDSRNMPQQRYVEQGLFEIKESNVQNPDGSVRTTRTTKVTGKGQIYFVNKFLALE